ncbi:MAG: hypothetical protein FWD84_01380 [Oscillospiraceae bacterium]|nr:hypothetical protein [Oscillospiraceae bacterium]
MKKVNVITCVLSGAGVVLSLVGLILRIMNGDQLFQGLSIGTLVTEPLVWGVISGAVFISAILPLLGKEKTDKE